ncbi:hypothetical protein SLEP1_g50059 [Rubroshorea leprosula]|uniref:Uncharacterized protein n=1 Tax=Rubroshorea leprosula TaxID=152421 RepID=A0AAV5LYR8_9ROSI|nr:hypothetical protein SLEP1_g50059 [Rubroshorea leprosula]
MAEDELGSMFNRIQIAKNEDGILPLHMVRKQDDATVDKFQASLTPEQYDFSTNPFWVRIFDVPVGLHSKETGFLIGSSLGRVLEVDEAEFENSWCPDDFDALDEAFCKNTQFVAGDKDIADTEHFENGKIQSVNTMPLYGGQVEGGNNVSVHVEGANNENGTTDLVDIPLSQQVEDMINHRGKGKIAKANKGCCKRLDHAVVSTLRTENNTQNKCRSCLTPMEEERALKVLADNIGVALAQLAKAAQGASRNVSVGDFLTANDQNLTWQSSSGDFELVSPCSGPTYRLLLAIWFAKIPEKTIVRSANGDNLVEIESKVKLTSSGLVLTARAPSGLELLWTNSTHDSTGGVSHAAMLDIGNCHRKQEFRQHMGELPQSNRHHLAKTRTRLKHLINLFCNKLQEGEISTPWFGIDLQQPSVYLDQEIEWRFLSKDTLLGSGPCGYDRICQHDQDGGAVCQCPFGFSFLDAKNQHFGCKLDYQSYQKDCNKDGAILEEPELNNGIGNCWKKKVPLSNG